MFLRTLFTSLAVLVIVFGCFGQDSTVPAKETDRYTTSLDATRNLMMERYKTELAALDSILLLPKFRCGRKACLRRLAELCRLSAALELPYNPNNYNPDRPPVSYCTGSLSRAETAIVARVSHVLELVFRELVSWEPGYRVNKLSDRTRAELAFYNIKDGEAFAEIGTGTGYFGLILAAANPRSQVILTELNELKVNYFRDKVRQFPELHGTGRVKDVAGRKNDANLPAASFDKIIIHNTFYHFRKTKAMVKSIHTALKPGGELLIAEPIPGAAESGVTCKRVREAEEEIAQITKGGFTLQDRTEVQGWYFLKFRRQ